MTVCVQDRLHLLGKIINDEMQVNEVGAVVIECWTAVQQVYSFVTLDAYQLMPNHFHGILCIDEPIKTLGRLIGAFKSTSTKKINALQGKPEATIWQRNFYEHIIRDENDLNRIRNYIINNPTNWLTDAENR